MKTAQDGEIWLNPGEVGWGPETVRIKTVLGSCVSLCFWHPRLRIGGMTHFMLPERTSGAAGKDGRYAEESLEILVAQMHRHGTRPAEYIAKCFGGASVLTGIVDTKRAGIDVGLRNVEAAKALIQRQNLSLVSSDLGGQVYRRIIFDLSTGDVWLQRLPIVNEKTRSNS